MDERDTSLLRNAHFTEFLNAKLTELSILVSTFNDRAYVSKKLKEIQAQSVFEQAEFFLETASPEYEPKCWRLSVIRNYNCRLITTEDGLPLY